MSGDEQAGNDCRRVSETSSITTQSIKATLEEVEIFGKVGRGRLFIGTEEVEPVGEGTDHEHQASTKYIKPYP